MTKYELVEELSQYTQKTYGFAINLYEGDTSLRDKSSGKCDRIRVNKPGHSWDWGIRETDFKQGLYKATNEILNNMKRQGYI